MDFTILAIGLALGYYVKGTLKTIRIILVIIMEMHHVSADFSFQK